MANGELQDKTIELLEKMLAIQLFGLGVAQGRIAKIVGKSKTWVNGLLKGVKPPSSAQTS
jgi:hypothetical protein